MRRFALVFFLLLIPWLALCASGGTVKVYVNGQALDVAVVTRNGIAYVPVQTVAVALKIRILWNPNNMELVVNGKPFSAGTFIKGGALYVPVEAIARGVGAPVEWDGVAHAIRIQAKGITPGNGPEIPLVEDETSPPPDNAGPDEMFFVPRTTANSEFSVTVTNVEETSLIKNYYKPKPGSKFVVVHVSEQNISEKVQMYTGRFSLEDQESVSYDYLDGLSNFFLQILRPGGINFGSLVFEIPKDTAAAKLVLHTYGNPPLVVSLR